MRNRTIAGALAFVITVAAIALSFGGTAKTDSHFQEQIDNLSTRVSVLEGFHDVGETPTATLVPTATDVPPTATDVLPTATDEPVGELAVTLQRIREEVPGFDGRTPVHLVADDGVPWDVVVNAYNAALFARFEKIYFVGTRP